MYTHTHTPTHTHRATESRVNKNAGWGQDGGTLGGIGRHRSLDTAQQQKNSKKKTWENKQEKSRGGAIKMLQFNGHVKLTRHMLVVCGSKNNTTRLSTCTRTIWKATPVMLRIYTAKPLPSLVWTATLSWVNSLFTSSLNALPLRPMEQQQQQQRTPQRSVSN